METKFEPWGINEDCPELEYLINLGGALVPIAHIKIIGGVLLGMGKEVKDDGSEIPLWGFPVLLTDSVHEELPRENPQILFDAWETMEEAEVQRRNLAIQVDNYYKRLLGDK
ncbi:hypothetical protein [Pseudodesulfovibrio karagichevae]|uniref:Uncharacterized protein n=1 Tax=Pseudodesulfovibrio karagichevae TaxID=3239305 RepID=A0ABV4JXH2_9BACT